MNRTTRHGYTLWLACLSSLLFVAAVAAADRPPSTVPPALEIEVLDPGVDPLGNPAVVLRREDGQMVVDIPPVVLVHRFYYTGDRSFQAQMLPGGPSIVVVNHPRNGERCYIPIQMMPGAPRVTYTGHEIQYDYLSHVITISFGLFGKPSVHYRSGTTWSDDLAESIHAEQIHDKAERLCSRSKTAATGAVVVMTDTLKTAATPAVQLLQMMPLGKVLFSSDLEQKLSQRAAEHKREKEIRHAQRQAELNNQTIRTIR